MKNIIEYDQNLVVGILTKAKELGMNFEIIQMHTNQNWIVYGIQTWWPKENINIILLELKQ